MNDLEAFLRHLSLDAHLAAHPAEVRALAWRRFKAAAAGAFQSDYDAKRVRNGKFESAYTLKKVGKRPKGGWPLFIAMHGGGGVPKRINDSQWRHMQIYYRDQPDVEGYLYVALRAPTDQWNGFYTGYMYPLMQKLIRQFLVCGDVDPDRVHAMGYSHGGYGAFAIGPKLPDLFASVHASASAPSGDTRAKNLMNTRFTFMIGEKDTAYGRDWRCKKFDTEIKKLRGGDNSIYPVKMEWKAGYGHGGLPDRDKIKDMYPHTRRAHPTRLGWALSDGVLKDHFWVRVESPKPGDLDARIVGKNRFEITTTGAFSGVELWLDERTIDPSRPVVVMRGARKIEDAGAPSFLTLLETLAARGDPGRSATRRVRLGP